MESDLNWFIGTQEMSSNGTKSPHVITGRIPISDQIKENLLSNLVLINEVSLGSPYYRFRNKYDVFIEYIQQTKDQSKTKSTNPDTLREIFGKLDDLLSAFRAFDDRTSHQLSIRYGKTSTRFKLFKDALSFEFDNVFAYRFSYQLRNYSQHAGSPITNIQSSARLKNEIPVVTLNINMNSKSLLEKYDGWNTVVKNELIKINGDISLLPILQSLIASCTRAYTKYLASQESEIMEAIKEVRKITDSFEPNEKTILLGIKKNVRSAEDLKDIQIIHIRLDVTEKLEKILQQIPSLA